MATQGGSVRWTFEIDTSDFDKSIVRVGDEVVSLKEIIEKTDSDLKNGQVFDNLSKNADEAATHLSNLKQTITNMGWTAFTTGATAMTGALGVLVSKGLQATDFLETSRVAMSGLIGSMEEGNKAMTIAADFWSNNPFQRLDVTTATKQLVQFGRQTGNLADDLKILGDVSLSTGANISDLARFYARVFASGRAMTMDLEIMSDRGIPIYRELSKVLNTTQEGVRKLASEGKIDFETFKQAMEGAVDAEAMEQYGETLARQKDRLSGSIQTLAGDLAGYKIVNNELIISAEGLEKAYTRFLKELATQLRDPALREGITKIGNALASVLDKITAMIPGAIALLTKFVSFVGDNAGFMIPILGGTLAFLGKLGIQIPVIGGYIQQLTGPLQLVSNLLIKFAKTNPILAVGIGAIGYALASAYKNSEEFRNTITQLLQAIGQLANSLIQSLAPVLKTVAGTIAQILSSKPVIYFLETVANLLLGIVNILNSLPKEAISALVGLFAVLAATSVSPMMGTITALALVATSILQIVEAVNELGGVGNALNALFDSWKDDLNNLVTALTGFGKSVVDTILFPFRALIGLFEDLVDGFAKAGNDAMVGLLNGLIEGARKVYDFIADLAKGILNQFKLIMQIRSPSRAMQLMGQYVTLGLAEGITDKKSAVQKAMDTLASEILNTAQTVIANKVDFGLLDIKDQYQEWKKVSQMFTEGSKQYQTAVAKMEEARKQANLRILSLQESYNDALDDTISKIATMYSAFQKVDLSGGMDATSIIKNMDQQVAVMEEWANAQATIASSSLDKGFIEELSQLGVESVAELQAVANMTSEELSKLNDMWLKKQAIANRAGVKQMESLKNDTLLEINKLKKGIDGETVDVADVGGRLVASISEGVTGAMPTLEDAFSKLDDYIAEAGKELSGSGKSAGASLGESLADGLSTPDTGSSISKAFDDIKANVGSAVDKLKTALGIGLAGVTALFLVRTNAFKKIASKFGTWISGKSGIGSKITKIFKDLPGKDTAQAAKTASDSMGSVSKSTESIGKSLESTKNSLAKANEWFKTIRQGAYTIIAIAAAIAAMAAALWATYNLMKDIDFLALAGQLGMMGGAVAEMGALAWTAQKLNINAKDFLPLIAAAGEIFLLAVALGALNLAIPADTMLPLVGKLGIMGLAVVEVGALALIASKIGWGQLLPGLIAVAAIAGEILLLGLALEKLDKGIQSDFDVMIGKLGIMGLVIGEIGVLGVAIGALLSTGIGSVFLGAGLAGILGICGAIVEIAEAIEAVDKKVPKDITKVKAKIDLIKDALESMANASFGNVIENWFKTQALDQLKAMAKDYAEITDSINSVNQLNVDSGKIKAKVESIRNALWEMSQINTEVGDMSRKEEIVGLASSIAWRMSEFAQGANQIQDIDKNTVSKVGTIRDAIWEACQINTGVGDMAKKEWVVGMATSIAWKFKEFMDAVNQLTGADQIGDKLTKITEAINTVANSVSENINAKLGDLEAQGVSIAGAIEKGILSKQEALGEAGHALQTSMWQAIQNQMEAERQQGQALAQKVIEGINTKYADAENAGHNIQTGVWWGIQNHLSDEYAQGVALAQKVIDGINSKVNEFENSGRYAAEGFVRGLNQIDVNKTGNKFVQKLLNAITKTGEQGSPWKTTMQSGRWAGLGLVEGLEEVTPQVVDEAESLAQQIIDTLSLTDLEIEPHVSGTVSTKGYTPVVDGTYKNTRSRNEVVINQTNNNYSAYSISQVNRDLAWQLAKV